MSTNGTSVAKRNRTLIALISGALLGVIVFAAASNSASTAFANSPLAIGDLTVRDQFEVGSWFRYDFHQYSHDGPRFYLVATINGTTFTASPDGDPIVAAKLGNTTWYTWDIKAYWMNDVEATSLYGRNDTGLYTWDNIAYHFIRAYNERHLRTLDEALDVNNPSATGQTIVNALAVMRPQFVNLGRMNNPYGSAFNVGFREVRSLVWGTWFHTYYRAGIVVYYDRDTLLLAAAGAGGREMCMTQYNATLRFNPAKTTDEAPLPGGQIEQGIHGSMYQYHLVLADTVHRSWTINITSNDTSVVPNLNMKTYSSGPIPIPTGLEGIASVNVSITADFFGVPTNPFEFEYELLVGSVVSQPNSTNITSAFDTGNNSILVEWVPISGADVYYVYVNDTYVGSSISESFEYIPPSNGTYDIYVVVVSYSDTTPSDPSNVVSVSFELVSAPFAGIGVQSIIQEPDSMVSVLIIVIVLVAASVGFFVLYRMGIVQQVGARTVSAAKKGVATAKKGATAVKRKVSSSTAGLTKKKPRV